MELLVGLSVVVLAVVGMYFTDRSGWHGTAKRLSRILRAQIESAKPLKAIEAKAKTVEKDSWESEFKQLQGITPEAELKHRIIKTGYYQSSSFGLWPEWTCKCGMIENQPRGGRSMEATQRAARAAAESHVEEANKSEELLAKTNGDFAW